VLPAAHQCDPDGTRRNLADRQGLSHTERGAAVAAVVAVVEKWAVHFCPLFHNRAGILRFRLRLGYTQRIYRNKVAQSLGEDEAKMLPDLDVGEALLSGQLINFPVLVRIKPSESKGEREEEDAFKYLE